MERMEKAWIVVVSVVLMACTTPPDSAPTAARIEAELGGEFLPVIIADSQQPAAQTTHIGRTDHTADGNRIIAGTGTFPDIAPIDILLDGQPNWLVSAPFADGILWAATHTDGRVQAFLVANQTVTEYSLTPDQLPAGMPPYLVIEDGRARLLLPDEIAPATHAVLLENGVAAIQANGDLSIQLADQTHTLAVNALPDGRILVDENERLLLLTDPTDQYSHNVLGDALEAASITLIETRPTPRIVRTIPIGIEAGWVIEGISPIWADLNDDGRREIIVTRSNAQEGAQIIAFNEDGTVLATGESIGRGFRWRHQLAVAPFFNDGARQLVDVLTPHIGGRVEFYRLDGDQLVIDTSIGGYTSHVIRSRNLDMGIAADWSGTGTPQLLLPSQDRTQLGAVDASTGTAAIAWTIALDGQATTNLSAVSLATGQLAVGAGTANNTLRIWQP